MLGIEKKKAKTLLVQCKSLTFRILRHRCHTGWNFRFGHKFDIIEHDILSGIFVLNSDLANGRPVNFNFHTLGIAFAFFDAILKNVCFNQNSGKRGNALFSLSPWNSNFTIGRGRAFFVLVVSIISPESFIISTRADYDHNARPRADFDHNARPRAVIMTVPKFDPNFLWNASGRLWEHKKPSCGSSWCKILALIISPKSDHNEGKSEFQGDNDKITWRSRAHGNNVRPRASASCCLRAASTCALWQPSGGRRRSRGGHYRHDPSTSHVIFPWSLALLPTIKLSDFQLISDPPRGGHVSWGSSKTAALMEVQVAPIKRAQRELSTGTTYASVCETVDEQHLIGGWNLGYLEQSF